MERRILQLTGPGRFKILKNKSLTKWTRTNLQDSWDRRVIYLPGEKEEYTYVFKSETQIIAAKVDNENTQLEVFKLDFEQEDD